MYQTAWNAEMDAEIEKQKKYNSYCSLFYLENYLHKCVLVLKSKCSCKEKNNFCNVLIISIRDKNK